MERNPHYQNQISSKSNSTQFINKKHLESQKEMQNESITNKNQNFNRGIHQNSDVKKFFSNSCSKQIEEEKSEFVRSNDNKEHSRNKNTIHNKTKKSKIVEGLSLF